MKGAFSAESVDQGLDFEAALQDSDLPKWKSGPQVRIATGYKNRIWKLE